MSAATRVQKALRKHLRTEAWEYPRAGTRKEHLMAGALREHLSAVASSEHPRRGTLYKYYRAEGLSVHLTAAARREQCFTASSPCPEPHV